ncbi:sucrase ferredoxin [Streptomyces sp. NPDC048172]|uniref:sucrase ferredoxin n=1 Tax=Streptomyces sp. NPDC048172 TaxID=3365505 RepID=UPI003715AEE7
MSTCATASRVLAEPLAATAATARTWLLVEQPGPWGAKALTESHFDPELGRALEAAAGAHGARVALIRRPGRHADCAGTASRRAFLAHTEPGDSWIRTAVLPDSPDGDEALRALDFAALAAGGPDTLPDPWRPYEGEPLALVCTNGKRDRCCALLGRPLAAELTASGTGEVWEITHIGGHRFSPTLLVLPYGYAYGRTGAAAVKDVLEAVREGRVRTEGCRGRSTWDRPGQAADLAVRERTGEDGADALTVTNVTDTTDVTDVAEEAAGRWEVTVAHRDGRRWRVTVVSVDDAPPVPASCGAVPGAPARAQVESIAQVTAETPV